MSPLYATHTLPPDSKYIRILTVHATPDDDSTSLTDDPPIESTLSIIDLSNAQVKFAALSYVWGIFAASPDTITCDNVSVKVTSNCLSALKSLRKKLGSFKIWVDAICIDQENVAEKEQQIPLMGLIYSSAETVYAWLGHGTDKTDRAMRYMATDRLSEYLVKHSDGIIERRQWAAAWSVLSARWSKTRHPIPFEDYTLSAKGEPPRFLRRHTLWQLLREGIGPKAHYEGDYARISDLRELLAKEWISRLWTYQEIVLATNPIVVCGLSHAPWDAFEKSLLFLDMNFFFAPQDLIRIWVSISVSREKLGIRCVDDPGNKSISITLDQYRKFMQDAARLAHLIRVTVTILGMSMAMRAILAFFVLEFYFKVVKYRLPIVAELLGATLIMILSLLPLTQRTISRKMRESMLPYAHEDFSTGLSWRKAKDPKDMAYGTWAMLQRAGATTLPKPDYGLPIGDVYRHLAFQLLQTTNSLNIAFLASQRNCSDQPSWVPDWSRAYKQQSRIETTNKQNVRKHTKSWIISGETETRRLLTMKPRAELDPTGTILTIQASVVGHISNTFLFQNSRSASQDEEKRLHVHNLRLSLMYATQRLGDQIGLVDLQVSRPVFPYSMLELLEIDSEIMNGEEASLAALTTWTRFIKKNRHKDVPDLTHLLLSDVELLSSHIIVCNLIATQQRTTVTVDLAHKSSSKQGLGTCSRSVQAGDQVVRVEGLPSLLVVRPLSGDSQTEVKIVSSINLAMIEERWWARYIRKRDFDPHFIEYRIH